MLDPKPAMSIKVAVFTSSQDQRQHLQVMLEKSGLSVVVSEIDGNEFLNKLEKHRPDVLLLDIGESDDGELEFLDSLTENTDIPILFNDSGPEGVHLGASGDSWAKKLAEKLAEMANPKAEVAPEEAETPFPIAKPDSATPVNTRPKTVTSIQSIKSAKKESPKPSAGKSVASTLNVWVLGASLGGPQAVRQFLAAIEEDLPVVFILAQHIGANHVSLLAEQLHRVTKFTVIPGKTGHQLCHGEVVLTPADKQLSLTEDGYLMLKPAPPATIYSPSIDNVMSEVANRYGELAGTIIFSGMGDDGARGCEAIAEHGGIVWAQDIASCVVSSMPDQARKTGKVSYSANPDQLAKHLYDFYNSNSHKSR